MVRRSTRRKQRGGFPQPGTIYDGEWEEYVNNSGTSSGKYSMGDLWYNSSASPRFYPANEGNTTAVEGWTNVEPEAFRLIKRAPRSYFPVNNVGFKPPVAKRRLRRSAGVLKYNNPLLKATSTDPVAAAVEQAAAANPAVAELQAKVEKAEEKITAAAAAEAPEVEAEEQAEDAGFKNTRGRFKKLRNALTRGKPKNYLELKYKLIRLPQETKDKLVKMMNLYAFLLAYRPPKAANIPENLKIPTNLEELHEDLTRRFFQKGAKQRAWKGKDILQNELARMFLGRDRYYVEHTTETPSFTGELKVLESPFPEIVYTNNSEINTGNREKEMAALYLAEKVVRYHRQTAHGFNKLQFSSATGGLDYVSVVYDEDTDALVKKGLNALKVIGTIVGGAAGLGAGAVALTFAGPAIAGGVFIGVFLLWGLAAVVDAKAHKNANRTRRSGRN
jgi:hypothetical protein